MEIQKRLETAGVSTRREEGVACCYALQTKFWVHDPDDAMWEIADHALARGTGARGLRSIIESALLDVMFELPSRRDVTKCVITKETIAQGIRPTLVTSAGYEEPEEGIEKTA